MVLGPTTKKYREQYYLCIKGFLVEMVVLLEAIQNLLRLQVMALPSISKMKYKINY